MSENEIRNSCADWLLFHGFLVIRPNMGVMQPEDESGKRRYIPFNRWQQLGDDEYTDGISDLLAFKPMGDGQGCIFLVVETKVTGNKPTPAQLRFLEAAEAHGAVRIVAHSVDDLQLVLSNIEGAVLSD